MSATVNIGKFKKIAKILIRVKKEVNIPIYVHGKKGVGKSEVTRQVAEEIGFDMSVINLASQTPEELLGLPSRDTVANIMTYLPPDWLKIGCKKNVIYFLDEINRAPKFVLQPIFPFILDGRLHRHQIKDTDFVIAAGNPSDLDHDVTEFEDAAFISRFAHFYLEPSKEEYLSYLETIGCSQSLVDSIDSFYMKIGNQTDPRYKVKSTPDNRNIAKLGILLNLMTREEIKEVGIEICSALVGPDLAPMIIENIWKTESLPSAKDIIENNIVEMPSFKIDEIQAMNARIAEYIASIGGTLDEYKYSHLKKYLMTLPKDAQVSFISELKFAIGSVRVMQLFQKHDISYITSILL